MSTIPFPGVTKITLLLVTEYPGLLEKTYLRGLRFALRSTQKTAKSQNRVVTHRSIRMYVLSVEPSTMLSY